MAAIMDCSKSTIENIMKKLSMRRFPTRIHQREKTFARMISPENFAQMHLPEAICPKAHLPEAIYPKTLFPEVDKSLFGRVDPGEWVGMTSPSSLAQKLTVQSHSSEKPSSTVDMVKGAAVDSAEGIGCHGRILWCRVPYMQQRMYSLLFPNFHELSCRDPPISWCRYCGCNDGSCRRYRVPLQSTKVQEATCATMDPAEGVGCSCRRVPRMQRKICALGFTNHRP